MNIITQISVKYLRPNRTMETFVLENSGITKTVLIYNYEGVHFRVFESQKEANKFLKGKSIAKTVAEFQDEHKLDNSLEAMSL